MNSRKKLAKLACGTCRGQSDLCQSLKHIASTLNELQSEFFNIYQSLEHSKKNKNKLYGPFIARSIMETSFTALVGRIDPFRLLILHQIQSNSNYEHTRRNASSIQWQGDVIPDEKDKSMQLWSIEKKPSTMTRSLFGDYFSEIFWKPSFESFLNITQSNLTSPHSQWVQELLQIEPEKFAQQYCGRVRSAYSKVSKGVHHEFVISTTAYYDEQNLKEMMEEAFRICVTTSLIANFCEHICFKLPAQKAIDTYNGLQHKLS